MRIGLIAIMLLGLGGFASAAPLSSPPTVTITPPAAALPPEVAALSGIWEGVWDGELPCRLAVEALTRDVAVVVYAWGRSPSRPSSGGWMRRRVPVLRGGTLQWEGRLSTTNEPVTFTFTLTKDRGQLHGKRHFHNTGDGSMVTMHKVPPSSRLTDLTDDSFLWTPVQRSEANARAEDALRSLEMTLGPTHPDVAIGLSNLAALYQDQGRYAEAEPLHQRALAIRETTFGPEDPAVATSLYHLARLSYSQGRDADAEALHQRALAIRQQTLGPDHPQFAQSLNMLANLYRARGRYAEAEPLLRRALAIREETLGPPHPTVASSLDTLADLYRNQGRYADAEPLYRRALAIRESTFGPDHSQFGTSLYHLAELARAQGRYAEAEPLYQRALAVQHETLGPTHPGTVHTVNGLADLYRAQGRYAEAESLYRRTLAIQEQRFGPSHPGVALSLANLATVLAQQHQRAQARPLFERARQIFLAVSRADGGLNEEAYRGWLRTATGTLRSYVALLATMAGAPERESFPPAPGLAAFVVAEQMRGGAVQLALAGATARAAATDPAAETLARQVQELQQRQRAVWRQLNDTYGSPGTEWEASGLDALRQTRQQVQGALAEATAHLQQAFPRYAELAAPEPIEVPTVQALLHRDEALISWFTLPDRVLVWLVRPHQAPVYRDVPMAQATLTATVARVRRSLAQGPWQPFDVDAAHALYTLLLAPLRESLAGATHLFLVPDDVLRPVPFGALITEATGQAYRRLADLVTQSRRPTVTDFTAYAKLAWLTRDYALTTLPSATALRALRRLPRTQRRPGEPLLAFGDPLLQGDGGHRGGAPMLAARGGQVPLEILRRLPRLPETRAELRAIATALGADPHQALYLGEQATKPMLKALHRAGRLGQAQVLAFATHALLAGELAGLRQPALVLTPPATASDEDDGLLTLEEIVGLTLPQASWVVLSACNTAADDGSGEALSGLARAFFHAGAAALLVSQWSVDDVATRVLMTEVFRRQAGTRDLPRAEALRQAMLALMTRAQGKTAYFAHPFAWAPFMLVGEGGRGRP